MANKRHRDYDVQSERIAALKIVCDHADFEEAKTILASLLAPLISELSSYVGTLDRTSLMRVNLAGNEYSVTPNEIYNLINNLDSATPAAADKFRFSDADDTYVEKKCSGAALAAFIADESAITNQIAAIIATHKTGGISNIPIKDSEESETYGYLTLTRNGKNVNGHLELAEDCTDKVSYNAIIPAILRPDKSIYFDLRYMASDPGYLIINGLDTDDGKVGIRVEADLRNYGHCFPINYDISDET
jgi:hypothetical protein